VFRLEQRLLCLQNGQKVRRALPILQTTNLKGFACRRDFASKMIRGATGVGDLDQRSLDISIGVKRRTLISSDESLLGGLGQILLPDQAAAIENGLRQIKTIGISEIRALGQRANRSRNKTS